jgi:hypothetical protein
MAQICQPGDNGGVTALSHRYRPQRARQQLRLRQRDCRMTSRPCVIA